VLTVSAEPVAFMLYILVAELITLFFLTFHSAARPYYWFLNGGLFMGAALALVCGVVLLPLSLIGLLFAIGVLGLIPFFTARQYWKRLRELDGPWPDTTEQIFSMAACMGLLLIGPTLMKSYVEKLHQNLDVQLMSKDKTTVQQAMQTSNNAWYCKQGCKNHVVRLFWNGDLPFSELEFRNAFKLATGEEYDSWPNSD
jgi:hypothetical protein